MIFPALHEDPPYSRQGSSGSSTWGCLWVSPASFINHRKGHEFMVHLMVMAIEIVDLPIDSMVIFHSELLVYQRVMVYHGEYGNHWKMVHVG